MEGVMSHRRRLAPNPAWLCALLAMGLACFAPLCASADPVEDFYRGKTMSMLIGVGAGGEYDTIARLVARHIGRHIPGHPSLVPQNMTGASGLKMINYLATVAPHDGTFIGMVSEGLPSLQAVGMPGVQFDARAFNWLGAIAPIDETMAVWHSAGVASIDDARKRDVVTGATARGSITYTFPALLNELFGTRFKLVTGYSGGNEINLAMERGEVEARNNTWSSWKATRPAWLAEHKLSILLQSGPKPKDLDAPIVAELAGNADDRKLIDLVLSGCALGRPLAITPDVPAERVAALRAAFDATMKDPDFLAEAKALNLDVDPIRGVDLQATVGHILDTPPEVARRARHLLE
jgi:tripartite-type tricarboxylate transporter receptor subunit TctC